MEDMYVKCQWADEARFLEEHCETVDVLLSRIGDIWRPNYRCTNAERQRREMLPARGQLTEQVFDSAVMFYGRRAKSQFGV